MTIHKTRTVVKSLALTFLCLFISSCKTTELSDAYVSKNEVQAQLTKMKIDHQKEMDTLASNLNAEKNKAIKGQDDLLQDVTNTLYGADLAFNYYVAPEPSRVDLIVNNRVKEAMATTGKTPTAEAMKKENDRLLKELDETKTSLADLRAAHLTVVNEKKKMADQVDNLKLNITNLENSIQEKKKLHEIELSEKKDKIIELQDKINLMEKKRSDDAEWVRAAKMKAMCVLGVLGLLCAAGAIWLPVFRTKFVTAAAVFGLAAGAVMYIQPWMIGAGVGAVILVVVLKAAYEHHVADKTATNLIGYVEEQKTTNPSAHNKSALTDWNGKYKKDKATGKTTVVKDPSVEAYIDQKKQAILKA